jgi:hypothetical protein
MFENKNKNKNKMSKETQNNELSTDKALQICECPACGEPIVV